MKPTAPFNSALVQIDKEFNDEIVLASGIKLFQDTTYRPEWHATATGKVVSLPRRVDGRDWPGRDRINPDLQVGDEIAFSYLVIFDVANRDDGEEVFYQELPYDPFVTTYSNRRGRMIAVRYRIADDRFDVAVFDGRVLYDKQERLSAVERDNYLGRYKFAETNEASFNNLVEVGGEKYWRVDYGHILGVRRGNELMAAPGKVILSRPELTMAAHEEAGIVLLNERGKRQASNQAESKIIALGKPLEGAGYLDVEPGDRVLYDIRFAEQYELWGSPILVLPQKRLMAKL